MPTSSELFTVRTPQQAQELLMQHFQPVVRAESVSIGEALGRVLAANVAAPEDLPTFRRSTVDGYAVSAADTYGASPGLPALLTVVGEATMGQMADMGMGMGEAVLVHTGSALPDDADAVVMVEHTQSAGQQEIEVMRPIAAGENVFQVGEDVRRGEVILRAGQPIRPQDVGGLAALGIVNVLVAQRPRVGIISTGDEIVPPDHTPHIGQIRDVNSVALGAMVQQVGGLPVFYGIVPDVRARLVETAARAKAECDIVVLSAGSSVSYRDMSVEVIHGLGQPGVLVHGVSVKPGKPTIIALADGVPVFGLPGNPVSAMTIFNLFVTPIIRALLGASERGAHRVQARLTRNIASVTGREDHVQVTLEQRDGVYWATPVAGKPNQIFTMVRATGVVCVPLNANGITAGESVTVRLDA
ncbi:MAG: molybdopterin molybdotransferase MoeA [Anaerolineae bacterium]|nr:molybdopterin molybdotransferase MoeA [Anaerolineae bacterium]